MGIIGRVFILAGMLFTALPSFAQESETRAQLPARPKKPSATAVLPKGVWHAMLRFGVATELSNRYDSSGSYWSAGRMSQAFTGENLKNNSDKAKNLLSLLKQSYPHMSYAEQLSLGNLEFEAEAEARYFAPALAYGITNNLSIGIGVPIVSVKAKVRAHETGTNNAAEIRQQITADGFPDISAQTASDFREVEKGADYLFRKELRLRGYEVPEEKNETVIGDLQLVGMYQYHRAPKWLLYEITWLNLPTGPQDDPDDFLDVPIFHQTSAKFDFHQDYLATKKLTLGTNVAYQLRFPDRIEKRVPENEGDMIPREDRKETVSRDLGDIMSLGSNVNYWLTKYLSVGGGYEYSYKFADQYDGNRGYNYSLLSRNTQGDWHRINLTTTFSTMDMFFDGEFLAPFMVTYTYSDIVAGRNVDRQMIHDVALKLFF